MGAMSVGCYKQMSTIKEGVIMRLQCNLIINLNNVVVEILGFTSVYA